MTKIESPMWLIVSIIENRFGFKQANLTVELADISVFFFFTHRSLKQVASVRCPRMIMWAVHLYIHIYLLR